MSEKSISSSVDKMSTGLEEAKKLLNEWDETRKKFTPKSELEKRIMRLESLRYHDILDNYGNLVQVLSVFSTQIKLFDIMQTFMFKISDSLPNNKTDSIKNEIDNIKNQLNEQKQKIITTLMPIQKALEETKESQERGNNIYG